jgi:hypothetical protein
MTAELSDGSSLVPLEEVIDVCEERIHLRVGHLLPSSLPFFLLRERNRHLQEHLKKSIQRF